MEAALTLLHASRNLYAQNTARIKTNGELTEAIHITKGCRLSPTLFKIYMNRSLQGWHKQCGTMCIDVGEKRLNSLYFADNQVVVPEDMNDLIYMVRKLQGAYIEQV